MTGTLFLEYLANGQNILFLDPRAGAGLAEPSLTFASGLDLAMCGFTFITHSILGNGLVKLSDLGSLLLTPLVTVL